MQITPQDRVDEYRERGWWGGETVDAVFRRTVAARGDAEALVDPPNRQDLTGEAPLRLTFQEVDQWVDRMARAFCRLGVRRDDVITVQIPNVVEGVIAFLACARMGAILSPLPMAYRQHELRAIFAKADPVLFITVEHFHGFDHFQMADDLRRDGSFKGDIVLVGAGNRAPALADVEKTSLGDPDPTLNNIEAADVLTLCWTSGTEAAPKGVPRNHDHWLVNAEALCEVSALTEADTLLNPFPLINIAAIGGMVLPWLTRGARLVQHHPFDLPTFLRQMNDEKVSYTVAPPAILGMLIKNPDLLDGIDISSLRSLGSGSAPLAPHIIEAWQTKYGISVMNFFGSNEGCSLLSTHLDVPDPTQRARYFPRFGVPGIEWETTFPSKVKTRLVDPDTEMEINEPGTPGELRIDGAMVFDGYWQADDINAMAFDDQGYFRTGDLFEIANEPGHKLYQFVGRSKEIIIRGGVNISPAELDTLIERHPKVREAACAAFPDDRLGEKVCAIVVLQEGETLTLEELTDFMRDAQVSTYKLPEKLRLMDALPRNPLGKVLRRELADISAS